MSKNRLHRWSEQGIILECSGENTWLDLEKSGKVTDLYCLHNRPEHSALQQSRQRHPFVDAHRFGAPRRVDPDRLERLDRARNALQALAEHLAALAEAFFGEPRQERRVDALGLFAG